jgi:hypothetical protein
MLEPVRLVCRKPTAAEIAMHQAMRWLEMSRTGVTDGIHPPLRNFYIRRVASGAEVRAAIELNREWGDLLNG